jgi:hypothetical protein
MRGKRLTSCLLVEAADGYRVVIALPELIPHSRTSWLCSPFFATASLSAKKKDRAGL